MAGSAEYEVLIRHAVDLRLIVKENLFPLAARLVSAMIITSEQYYEIRNAWRPVDERAANLVGYVQDRVKRDPRCYHVFIDALRSDLTQYGDILVKLEESLNQHVHPLGGSDRLQAKGVI